MIIIPSMEIANGKCVSLRRGRLDEPMVWHVDPVEKAREFAACGASWMQLTDIDAIRGSQENRELVIEIIRNVGIPVQLGGGFRSLEMIREGIEIGAGRIAVGTIAVLTPDVVHSAAKLFPDQIVISIDVWQGAVMTHGWNEPSAITPEGMLEEFKRAPLAAVAVTDIDSNIDNRKSSLKLLKSLAGRTRTPLIASGVIRKINDIKRLTRIPNVEGALVGTALYNRTIELEDALAAALPLERGSGRGSGT